MGKVFNYRGRIYSISDKSANNDFVVVKLNKGGNKVEASKVIPGKTEEQIEKLIKTRNFESFKNLEDIV